MTGTTRRATLEVAGMTCPDCEHHAAAALERAGPSSRRLISASAWPVSPCAGAWMRRGCGLP